jgi:hypothetical protein
VSLMATSKALKLSVALPPAPIGAPRLRQWALKEDKEIGYRYLESRDLEFKAQDFLVWNEVADALLNLVEPIRELTLEEKKRYGEGESFTMRDETSPDQILSFLNTYGQVGLADYNRRASFLRPFTLDGGELTSEQFRALVNLPHYKKESDRKKQARALKEKFANHSYRFERLNRISWGFEIPLVWVERDLFDLYKCVRIILALDKNYTKENIPYFSLTMTQSRALRNFLLASQKVAVPLGKSEDYKYLKSNRWKIDDKVVKAEWEKFAINLNRFLTPISKNSVYSDLSLKESQKTLGVETWLAYKMLESRADYSEKVCQRAKCGKPYVGQRNTKRFCSKSCATTQRVQIWKEKKRNSSGKSRKKAQAKGKKKNG